MKRRSQALLLGALWALTALAGSKGGADPLIWEMDNAGQGGPWEIVGHPEWAAGVKGEALLLDGTTTFARCPAEAMPKLRDRFTVQAWVALGAYPLNWAPLWDWHDPSRCGFFFGVDAYGHPGVALFAGDRWQDLTSNKVLPLRTWHHLAATYGKGGGLTLFLDGEPIGRQAIQGNWVPGTEMDALVGRHRFKQAPVGTIRKDSTADIHCFLDGLIDGVSVGAEALDEDEIRDRFEAVSLPDTVALPERILPTGPSEDGPFGAFYARLRFYPQWDRQWPVGEHADVVVRFDRLPVRYVFWRGTSYIPHWVTENGIWYTNEFNETWGPEIHGCAEPMSDKKCRFSHVRIIENHAARTVVHWRYPLVDVFYQFAKAKETEGWGEWTDEVHTIYPDGTAVRSITLHSPFPDSPHEWHESIVVMGPGRGPNESIHPEGLTMMNLEGESVTFSWREKTPPKRPRKPKTPCIQRVNTLSEYKPFAAVRPRDNPSFDVYAGEIRRDLTIYPWWNHWPAAAYPSDGRYACAADRPSHSSLSHFFWDGYKRTERSLTKIMLTGMTDGPAEEVLPLVRAWASPAQMEAMTPGVTDVGFLPEEKAFHVRCAKEGQQVSIRLKGSSQCPVICPAFVLEGWGFGEPQVSVDGKVLKEDQDFRWGIRTTLKSTDLVLWIDTTTEGTLEVRVRGNRE